MTPLQLFLLCILIFLLCLFFDRKRKTNENIAFIGGLSIIGIVISLIWCIFHYVKI